ncbi:YqcI/YcgG family protein [Kitasatospora sp. NBC_00240]|uniref:YqcI/YcgG family protein n=1 Tax=Kitasatospora sp. NBC_00240 TaxID=2903567 RepID=UPI0022559A51|nr:YqcI/YcgG family protein [Kitasatospora sp. NBC_00240]MCX5214527.1 YqcI/YcgG family protein [Kitasatospora sp. NBC_00240]
MLYRIDELHRVVDPGGSQLLKLVGEFSGIVNTHEFPCVFSTLPFNTAELFFGRVPRSDGEAGTATTAALLELTGIIRHTPDAIGVVFVDQPGEPSLDDDLALARSIVRAVMRQNVLDHPDHTFPDPRDHDWELWLDGVGLFLNFSSPRHKARRSRNVGSRFTVVAQARESFDRQARGTPRARDTIRRRLADYDDVEAHPALGSYGDPDSREALQFFLGDGLEAMDVTEGEES